MGSITSPLRLQIGIVCQHRHAFSVSACATQLPRQAQAHTQTQRQTDRHTQTQTQTHTDTDTDTHTETDRQAHADTFMCGESVGSNRFVAANALEMSRLTQRCHHGVTGLKTVLAMQLWQVRTIHPPALVDDFEQRQLVAQPGLVVIGIMSCSQRVA